MTTSIAPPPGTCPDEADPLGRPVRKLLSSLRPSPENDTLYDRRGDDIVAFADRIRAEGLLEPLVITADNYILSGHRRYTALGLLDRVKVPCRQLPVRRADLGRDEYVALLRRYNRQRDKSVAERVREAMVDLDPGTAHGALCEARDRSVNAAARNGLRPLLVEGSMHRHRISADKDEHVGYVLRVVEERRPYWPLSVRGVHYPLLNFDFVRGYYHPQRKDPDFGRGPRTLRYRNDDGSYDATSDLVTRLRLAGRVPWAAFDDPTRPVTRHRPIGNAQEFVTQEVKNVFSGYWRDLLQSQPNHVEVLVENNTV